MLTKKVDLITLLKKEGKKFNEYANRRISDDEALHTYKDRIAELKEKKERALLKIRLITFKGSNPEKNHSRGILPLFMVFQNGEKKSL